MIELNQINLMIATKLMNQSISHMETEPWNVMEMEEQRRAERGGYGTWAGRIRHRCSNCDGRCLVLF